MMMMMEVNVYISKHDIIFMQIRQNVSVRKV